MNAADIKAILAADIQLEDQLDAERVPHKLPAVLWNLQVRLITLAVSVLGPRNTDGAAICKPIYSDNSERPRIELEPDRAGHFIIMSRTAARSLTATFSELAYLTTFLLDPPNTERGTVFAHGVAGAFERYALDQAGLRVVDRERYPEDAPFVAALRLADSLPGGALTAGRRARSLDGSLANARASTLAADEPTAAQLLKRFAP